MSTDMIVNLDITILLLSILLQLTTTQTGDMSLLLINEVILIPSMKNILLCIMQCHLNGVSVPDVPKFVLKNPMMNYHVVIIPSDSNYSPLLISLMLQGVTSYFPV